MDGVNNARVKVKCCICGCPKDTGETWFLITGNCWEDRLKIWKWSRSMAGELSAQSLCGQGHVLELVVHWMTTGCLDYPFTTASATLSSPKILIAQRALRPQSREGLQIGELAIDRGSLARVIRENPLSLNTILDELMFALDDKLAEELDGEFEAESDVTLRMM